MSAPSDAREQARRQTVKGVSIFVVVALVAWFILGLVTGLTLLDVVKELFEPIGIAKALLACWIVGGVTRRASRRRDGGHEDR